MKNLQILFVVLLSFSVCIGQDCVKTFNFYDFKMAGTPDGSWNILDSADVINGVYIFPPTLLVSGLLIPFLGFSNSDDNTNIIPEEEEEYTTLLKADGTAVKIKTSTLNKSKIVKKNISNKSFLNWLGKKL